MNTYEIWTEGFHCSDGSSGAAFRGKFPGETFREAVMAWRGTLPKNSRGLVDLERMSYWGCGIHDNEAAARKSFG